MPDFPRYTTERSQLSDQITVMLEDPMTTPDRIAQLTKRLEDGWERINQAEEQGADTGRWTSFWCDLLKQYEALVDEVETHAEAREQARMF